MAQPDIFASPGQTYGDRKCERCGAAYVARHSTAKYCRGWDCTKARDREGNERSKARKLARLNGQL